MLFGLLRLADVFVSDLTFGLILVGALLYGLVYGGLCGVISVFGFGFGASFAWFGVFTVGIGILVWYVCLF